MFGRSSSTGPPVGPSTGGGLFGNTGNQQSTSGGLFGNNNATSGNTGGGLFGNNNNTATQTGGGLFGSNPAGTNNNTNQTAGGLFGSSNNTATGSTGGLFGNSGAGSGGGLFGNKSAQPQTTGFGSSGTGGGLFGSKPAQPQTTGFGGSATGGGLFGSKPTTGGPFGNQQQQSQQSGLGMFGQTQNQFQQPPQQQIQQTQQSAINFINQLAITPMTKISELPIQIRQEIEQLDQFIRTQVSLSKHLEADLQDQTELLDSIPRDIKYLQKLHFNATRSLSSDLKRIDAIKTLVDKDVKQLENFAIMLQQLVSKGFKISNVEIDKFFQEKLITYKHKLNDYNDTLSNIDDAVSGLENDLFGNDSSEDDDTKVGINIIVSVLIEEFKLFMDTAERIAELHQKCKEIIVK